MESKRFLGDLIYLRFSEVDAFSKVSKEKTSFIEDYVFLLFCTQLVFES